MALPKRRRYTPALLMLGAGTLLSVIASLTVGNLEKQSKITQFKTQSDELASALQRNIDINLGMQRATGKLYAASEKVDRQEFETFVEDFVARYPSILGFNWSPRVLAGERQAFEEAVRAEGYPTFQIIEPGGQGQMVRAGQRPEYFPITYISLVQLLETGLGIDLISNPIRRAALEKARDTGEMATTERIEIVTTKETGFLTFQPIYRKGASLDSLPSRRQNFQGVITGIFQIRDIIKVALAESELNNINFYLLDNSTATQERFLSFYQSKTQELITDASREPPLKIDAKSLCWRNQNFCTRTLQVADHQWSLLLIPESEYMGIFTYFQAWLALVSGLILTTFVTGYIMMALRHTMQVEHLVQERTAQAEELELAIKELKKAQVQLIQTEKMSSLGQLVAGVAHEINNPVNFIYGNLTHTHEYVDNLLELVRLYQQHYPNTHPEIEDYSEDTDIEFIIEDLPKMLASMKMGAERIRQIVLSLRNFSRFDEADMKQVNIHEGIDNTLLILQNRLKAKPEHPAIQVIKKYGNLPLVECYAGQLNQVFMNIIANAIDALDTYNADRSIEEIKSNPSTIAISTAVIETGSNKQVSIKIADNGPGMTPDVKKRLFDPFFTTKPIGKGTGLGLSISYQVIVEKHNGVLRCESEFGKGTEFNIEIPVQAKYPNC